MSQPAGGIGNVVPNTELLEMAMAFSRSRVLCAAARLEIADALGNETRSLAYLAEHCDADPDSLYRLLRTLAAIGVTEETSPQHFRLTEFGQPLRKDAPKSIWPDVIFWADLLADSWSFLTDCVRAGKPAQAIRDPNIPSRWVQDPNAGAIFRAVMGTAPASEYSPIAQAWDFSRSRVVADLGGGGGSLLLAILELYPHLRGMLVDLEPSIQSAQPRFAREAASSRSQLVVCDLLRSVPPGADVYVLKHVLHGRRDPEAIAILKNCRAVIPGDGTLLIIEYVLPPLVSHPDPHLASRLLSDLNMLVVTGGRERSEREWQALFDASGFTLTRVLPVGGDALMVRNVGIVEAHPA